MLYTEFRSASGFPQPYNDATTRGTSQDGQYRSGHFYQGAGIVGKIQEHNFEIDAVRKYGYRWEAFYDNDEGAWRYFRRYDSSNNRGPLIEEETSINFLDLDSEEISYIRSGEFHTSFLTKDNNLYSYGKNTFGQLGHETDDIICYPKLVNYFKLNKIIINNIALGGEHTLALSNKNELFSWGLNIFGQLGINSTVNSKIPIKIEKIRNSYTSEGNKEAVA